MMTCVFLALVHDVGKLSAEFIHNISKSLPETVNYSLQRANALDKSYSFAHSYPQGFLGAKIFEVLSEEFPVPDGIRAVVAAHHGKPLESNELILTGDYTIDLYGGDGENGENGDLAQELKKLWNE